MFVPGKPFQPSLVFVGEARSLPFSGAPERYFTSLARDKHSSLLQTIRKLQRFIVHAPELSQILSQKIDETIFI